MRLLSLLALAATLLAGPSLSAAEPRAEFTRLVAHWDQYGDAGYPQFISDAHVQVAQVGFYGAHFYSLAHTPQYKGYPAHFPVQGLKECGAWFEQLNANLHGRGAKVVGHFNCKFLVGDPAGPDGPRGFFKYYRDLWDEQALGKRPVDDPLQLLERDAQGAPIVQHAYKIGGMAEYWGCLNNPHWRAVLKAWAKQGIERGVDGYMINYFYRHDCLCEHCVGGFKKYLQDRHTPEQLQKQFEIADLAGHKFPEIVAWHDPKESTPLRREMLRFSQIANKRAYDEVFVEYARGLKPGLLLGQWNHLGDFNQINGDERSLLPAEQWGKDEDYAWYSTGGAANHTDLASGMLGEGTLQARYIRGMLDDKPFTLGKYEQTRIRAAIAELAANGGAPLGFYARFTDPAARAEIVRYYSFLKRYDDLYRGCRPYSEAVLVYPRQAILSGNVAPLAEFRARGKELLDEHVLFDVRSDDQPDERSLTGYRSIVRNERLPDAERAKLSRFAAPKTVRVSANRVSGRSDLTVHLVNYNRTEPEKKNSPGTGIVDEKPLATEPFAASLTLPAGAQVAGVESMTPEEPQAVALEHRLVDGRVEFQIPAFLVYRVVRVRLK